MNFQVAKGKKKKKKVNFSMYPGGHMEALIVSLVHGSAEVDGGEKAVYHIMKTHK